MLGAVARWAVLFFLSHLSFLFSVLARHDCNIDDWTVKPSIGNTKSYTLTIFHM